VEEEREENRKKKSELFKKMHEMVLKAGKYTKERGEKLA